VIAAAKRHIPRGYQNQYIPGCDEPYERFNSDLEKESAVRLLEKLNVQKKLEIGRRSHTPAAKPGTY
jgi:hypothetical protein